MQDKYLQRLKEQWERTHNELKQYVEREGKLPTRSTVTHTGYRLGKWINSQRQNYRKGILEGGKKERLEAIPYWSWNHTEEAWDIGYRELKRYVEQENRLPVQSIVTPTGYKLGVWVTHQRTVYRKCLLEENRQKRLEAIPYWSWNPIEEQWEQWYSELKRYVEQEGKLPTRSTVTHTGYRVGNWITEQRKDYRNGILKGGKKERLEAIPYWSWNPIEEKWEQWYIELKRYVEQENRLPVQSIVTPTGYKLGKWINSQRQNYKKGILEIDKQKRLEAIPYWVWSLHEEQWEQGYSELKRYVEQKNILPVFSTLANSGYRVGNWINTQRQNYKKGMLEGDKKERLEAIPYWVWTKSL